MTVPLSPAEVAAVTCLLAAAVVVAVMVPWELFRRWRSRR